MSESQVGRWPVLFAGKCPEVLEQALGELPGGYPVFFEALLIPAGSSPPGRSEWGLGGLAPLTLW